MKVTWMVSHCDLLSVKIILIWFGTFGGTCVYVDPRTREWMSRTRIIIYLFNDKLENEINRTRRPMNNLLENKIEIKSRNENICQSFNIISAHSRRRLYFIYVEKRQTS